MAVIKGFTWSQIQIPTFVESGSSKLMNSRSFRPFKWWISIWPKQNEVGTPSLKRRLLCSLYGFSPFTSSTWSDSEYHEDVDLSNINLKLSVILKIWLQRYVTYGFIHSQNFLFETFRVGPTTSSIEKTRTGKDWCRTIDQCYQVKDDINDYQNCVFQGINPQQIRYYRSVLLYPKTAGGHHWSKVTKIDPLFHMQHMYS